MPQKSVPSLARSRQAKSEQSYATNTKVASVITFLSIILSFFPCQCKLTAKGVKNENTQTCIVGQIRLAESQAI